MNIIKKTIILLPFVLLCVFSLAFGQGKPYDGPDDPAGDIAAERVGYMTGNRVYLMFSNTTELSDWPREDVSRWPNDYTGTKMTDGVNILICAQVYLKNDTIPVTDPAVISSTPGLDTLWYCQTHFRGGYDTDPTGTIPYVYYPVFGYFNRAPSNEYPAMSNLPNSWPPAGWPSRGDQLKWPGVWNGRFGLGVMYADLETYIVVNDAQDQEYLEDTDTVKYYPRPGKEIGYKDPNVSIQLGKPWGGIGTRVEARGYQWANPLARDAIFWEYNVSNISDYDLPLAGFGYHVDNAIGNDANDELGYFDTYLDLAFSWDIDEVGQGGVRTGLMGFAFLESPGAPYDGVDNDEDGIIDEQRDNQATKLVGPTDGYYDVDKFLAYNRLKLADLREHWDADEDQDWMDGEDLNNNGVYDLNENPGDDVGLDGIGPGEDNYPGPDRGECNHRPDYEEGIGCEPNFAATDVSESDMLGLMSFSMFPVLEQYHGRPMTFHEDWVMYQLVATSIKDPWEGQISNLIEVFGSGPFPLYKGRTERISMSMLHAYDELSDLNQDIPRAPVLFELKKVVQMIYEKDYRFAQPPRMPTLTATAGDGQVTLTWDNIADSKSREPFLGGINDFEGYKVIRATDKKFQDAMVVTDGYGTPSMYKHIFQCDKIDHIQGFTNFGLLNGMGYYLGDDSGIRHYFVDKNIQNGKTYYYGLIAYDYGIADSIASPGIAPSENNLVIELDEFEQIRRIGKNVQIVTPHQAPAGYAPSSLQILANSIKATSGTVVPDIVSRSALKPNHVYTIHFTADTLMSIKKNRTAVSYLNNGYYISDKTDSNRIVAYENVNKYQATNLTYDNILTDPAATPRKMWFIPIKTPMKTDVADGVVFSMQTNYITSQHGGFDFVHSGWSVGNVPVTVFPTPDAIQLFPWDYELIFTANPVYTGKAKATGVKDENGVKFDDTKMLAQQKTNFFMINKTFPTINGQYDTLDVVIFDSNDNKQADLVGDRFVFGTLDDKNKWLRTVLIMEFGGEPQPNDVYFATFNRPFFVTDTLSYKVLPEGKPDLAKIKSDMENIKVVPNPYVATNSMEPVVANWYLNQRRQIMFTHLPSRCDIKIFTMSGVLIKEIHVDNPADDGTAHWDVQTSEGLEVAAGMYLYHVKATEVDAEKIGKFAIIK
jgi:hypothetical protein